MKPVLLTGMALLLLAGCVAPVERVPLQPLPETGQVLPYPELLTRARAQATAANEAFYVNRWSDLEDLAKGLEQTARFLAKAEEVPKKNKDILKEVTDDMAKNALKLKAAAADKNVKDANDALQRINLKVRDLRLTD
jgi:predicted  nucleic acid-binding Zn-ribbon protein